MKLSELKTLTNEQLVCYIQDSKTGPIQEKAVETLIIKNMGLVRRIAHRFPIPNTDFQDREQEGVIGLLNAMKNYDRSKNVLFATHAWSWIQQNVLRECNKQGNMIQVPSHVAEARMKIAKIKNAFEKEHGRFATAEDIAKASSLDAKLVQHVIDQQGTVAGSIDEPISTGDDKVNAHEIYGGDSLVTDLLTDHNTKLLRDAIEILHPNEKFIVESVLGLGSDHESYRYSELAGIAVGERGNVLTTPSTVRNHFYASVRKLMQHIKNKQSNTPNTTKKPAPKVQEITFNYLLATVQTDEMFELIEQLHPNEQFILLAHNGLLDGEDECWTFEDLAGNVEDADGNMIVKTHQVKAEYRQILLELQNKIMQPA